jgi:hypothetical protein
MARTRRSTTDRPDPIVPALEREEVKAALARVQAFQQQRDSIPPDASDGTERYAKADEAVRAASAAYDQALAEAEHAEALEKAERDLGHAIEHEAAVALQPLADPAILVEARRDLATARARVEELKGEAVEITEARRQAELRAAARETQTAPVEPGVRAGQRVRGSAGFYDLEPVDLTQPTPSPAALANWDAAHPLPGLLDSSEPSALLDQDEVFREVVDALNVLHPPNTSTTTTVQMVREPGFEGEVPFTETKRTQGLGEILANYAFGDDPVLALKRAAAGDDRARAAVALALSIWPAYGPLPEGLDKHPLRRS